ncbi:hypothetical protein V8B97DRAFT_1937181 [Scleroderma yunnanense]
MSLQRPPCRFFSLPGGCRRGNQCHFAHDVSPAPSDAGTTTASNRPLPPKGVCRFYWEQGRCAREFDCRYRHETGPDVPKRPATPSAQRPVASPLQKERLAPFLTEQGLSRLNGGGTDGFLYQDASNSLSPVEAHNALQRFLFDKFRFQNAFQVYAFLAPLTSANSSNSKWTQEDGQLLLNTISSQNGLLRIVVIICWPQVSARAGSSREILSFQKGVLPILGYLSSDFVVKSTLVSRVNALLTVILQNLPKLADTIESCMTAIMAYRSFTDPLAGPGGLSKQIGPRALASIAGVLHECLVRFKNAVALYPRLGPLVTNLHSWIDQWSKGISTSPPSFEDPFRTVEPTVRDLLIKSLKERGDRLKAIVDREFEKQTESKRAKSPSITSVRPNEGVIAALQSSYDPPGELRPGGPRHDNDHADCYEIRVAPTHEELMCRVEPFLPASLYEAPHPAPTESMERLLDVQFRLLREELTAPLRRAVQLIHDDLKAPKRSKTQLHALLQKNGGKYTGYVDTHNSIMFNIYADVNFTSIIPDFRGLSVSLTVRAPPGRASARQSEARVAFWQGMSGKRLPQGGLIALVWETPTGIAVHLGVVASSLKELTDYARSDRDRVKLRIVFFDSQVELRILQDLENRGSSGGLKMLVESPVMFEAIRPFLEALKAEPETVPFSKYLVFRPPDFLKKCVIDPPKYTQLPGFTFQLASLFPEDAGVDDLRVDVSDARSVEQARIALRDGSRLDPSQADSIIDVLTREIALMQGPPGTGKSYTGVELLRVLIANNVKPILMIAFTNHALDHMLSSVLDAGITTNIVRLGSRSSDERISQYSIETRERVTGHSRLDRAMHQRHRELKDMQERIKKLMDNILKADLESDSSEVMKYLMLYHPEHNECLCSPPQWITVSKDLSEDSSEGQWQVQGRKGRVINQDTSLYAYWKTSGDLQFLSTLDTFLSPTYTATAQVSSTANHYQLLSSNATDIDTPESDGDSSDSDDSTIFEDLGVEELWMLVSDDEIEEVEEAPQNPTQPVSEPIIQDTSPEPISSQENLVQDPAGFFRVLGEESIPVIPSRDRSLQDLLQDGEVWEMSTTERERLHRFWIEQARIQMSRNQLEEFENLRIKHADKIREYNEGRETARREVLEDVDIIGCTTTGAAKLTTLLQALGPRVLLVEEAGQVLEAHVLGSLVPSVEHLILIGDPLQLRPTLNNFSLSMDSRRGRELFRFDMSLMERLSSSGLPMSRLDVQRRMRPSISSLIRNTLYPGLQDHDLVLEYPNVRGMSKNLYFVSHNHRENGGADDTASKYNMYEVEMIHDLVLYLLRQGCYTDEGDIVVLCAYLGQLARLRDAFAGEVVTVIDERDQADLADQEAEVESDMDGPGIEHIKVTKRVRLRTVDNYQGEEGKIIILSLVRNSGGGDDDMEQGSYSRPNIGFLKSENRTNVALSRAREGLYIFGNADNLSCKSEMWRSILEELQANDAVGPALPIACFRHPDKSHHISQPGQLPQVAPDGGCLEACNAYLKCGHICPFKCHADDPSHVSVVCDKPCRRLCHRDHPCSKACNTPCGDCMFPVPNIHLPCGHVKESVLCHQLDMIQNIYCDFVVMKQLPHCEHSAPMECSQDPENYPCQERCAVLMPCCSKTCKAPCYECQRESNPPLEESGQVKRDKHMHHLCQKSLHCEHLCQEACSENHSHTNRCMKLCRQACPHAKCTLPCSVPCAPCKEECTWTCPHYTCPVPCGSVCARLPCDLRCETILRCGHRCPSVCGEACDVQVCPWCASDEKQSQLVDLILQRSLSDVDPDMEGLDDLLITIPSCGHTFTVETLDGHCSMSEYYRQNSESRWTGLDAPSGFRRPPTCPTCRSVVKTPRYGRVYKRAELDILERNVAAQMSRRLGETQNSMERFTPAEKKIILVNEAALISLGFKEKPPGKKQIDAQKRSKEAVLNTSKQVPVPLTGISPENKELHTIHPSVLNVWNKAIRELLNVYKQAICVAETRSAHGDAWEAALSRLYECQLQSMEDNPRTAARNPQVHAMRMAKMKIGQPRPLADRRFLVEAFWLTLHIRLVLTDLIRTWLEEISKRNSNVIKKVQPKSWATYVKFLFDTCGRDADLALKIAKDSEARRQVTRTVLWKMRVELERFRFDLFMFKSTGLFRDQIHRDELLIRARELQTNSGQCMREALSEHCQKKSDPEETDWLSTNFSSIAQDIVDEWGKIERSIRLDTFYEPLSLQERMEIVKAFGYAVAGHFYNCPNGHTFVIGDCGGAMRVSTCPECGAAIGGSDHRLLSSNSRAAEYEELVRQAGAGPAHWANPW